MTGPGCPSYTLNLNILPLLPHIYLSPGQSQHFLPTALCHLMPTEHSMSRHQQKTNEGIRFSPLSHSIFLMNPTSASHLIYRLLHASLPACCIALDRHQLIFQKPNRSSPNTDKMSLLIPSYFSKETD